MPRGLTGVREYLTGCRTTGSRLRIHPSRRMWPVGAIVQQLEERSTELVFVMADRVPETSEGQVMSVPCVDLSRASVGMNVACSRGSLPRFIGWYKTE